MSLNASGFVNPLRGAQTAMSGFKSTLSSLAAPLLALAGAASVGALIGKSIQKAADVEQMQASFAVLTQSTSAAAAMIKQLQQISASTHLSLPGLGSAAQTLLSFGLETSKVVPALRMLGDVSGGNSDRFASLALVFGQTASAGKLMGQDLLQYINAGFNPLQEISKRTGKSMGELRKEVEAGNITFAQVSQAFTDATSKGGKFFGFTEAMGRTWNGLMMKLQASIETIMREFGQPVMDALKPFLSSAIKLTDKLAVKSREWGKAVGDAIRVTYQLFKSGDLGTAAGLALKIGFAQATNFLFGALKGIFTASISLLADGISGAFSFLGNGAALTGLGLVLDGIATTFGAELQKAVIDAFTGLKISIGGKTLVDVLPKDVADTMKHSANISEDAGQQRVAMGASMLSDAMEGSGAALRDSLLKAFDKFRLEIRETNLFGPQLAEWGAQLKKMISDAIPSALKHAPRKPERHVAKDGLNHLDGVGSGAAKLLDGDRLAKIGLFIRKGGAQGDHAKKTAENTTQLVRWQSKLYERLGSVLKSGGLTTGGLTTGTLWSPR